MGKATKMGKRGRKRMRKRHARLIEAERQERRATASTSVRAVSGGLPESGKRQRS